MSKRTNVLGSKCPRTVRPSVTKRPHVMVLWCSGACNMVLNSGQCYDVIQCYGVSLCYGVNLCYDVNCVMMLTRVMVLAPVLCC